MSNNRNHLEIGFIDRPTCYSKVYQDFLSNNQPCVLSQSFMETWPCRKLWVKNNQPNWDYIRLHYGEASVPVANCNVEHYNSHLKTDWKLNDYIDYLVKYAENDYSSSMECLYMKDWHFCKNFPDTPVYETPIYFSVDWLNEYWILGQKDDYRFVYIGPKGSWTPFHSDVYGSFSWSANITGKKRWILMPPGEELKLMSESLSLPNDLSKIDLVACGINFIDFVQKEGEIIFVPSGWHHQVWNLIFDENGMKMQLNSKTLFPSPDDRQTRLCLSGFFHFILMGRGVNIGISISMCLGLRMTELETTISINHNWFNAANLNWIHRNLVKAAKEVQDEFKQFSIETIDPDQLETVLQAHHGMNVTGFRDLLMTVIQRRESGFLKTHSFRTCPPSCCTSDRFCEEHQHRSSDLEAARNMLHQLTLGQQLTR